MSIFFGIYVESPTYPFILSSYKLTSSRLRSVASDDEVLIITGLLLQRMSLKL
jgi:hypothetical protein